MGFFDSIREALRGFGGDSLPPGTIRSDSAHLVPAPGYDWVTTEAGDFRVRWSPGKPLPGCKLVAGSQPGQVQPGPGYEWLRPGDPHSGDLVWVPGKPHSFAPHVVAAAPEGKWATEAGYRWLNRDHDDLRVVWDDAYGRAPAGMASGESPERLQRIRDLAALGLDEAAREDAIEAAFRRLVMIHHPDHFHGRGEAAQEAAESAFRLLRGAYERLKRSQGGRS